MRELAALRSASGLGLSYCRGIAETYRRTAYFVEVNTPWKTV